jgi:hypothetical protein
MTDKWNYWKETYGARSKDFVEGVIAGVRTYAVWKGCQQLVGENRQPLKEVVKEIKEGLGWKEEK